MLRIQELTADEINHLLDAVAAFKEVGRRRRKLAVFAFSIRQKHLLASMMQMICGVDFTG